MLICGPSGSGKTNVLLDIIFRLLFYDKIYLHAKNLEQSKYQLLLKQIQTINKKVGYDVKKQVIMKLYQFLNYQMIIKNNYI